MAPSYYQRSGPFKAAIGWVRFVQADDLAIPKRYRVEKMSYEDDEINLNPDVIINATSEPCGIEVSTNDFMQWTVIVGGCSHSRHADGIDHLGLHTGAWGQAKRAVEEMTVLDWLAML